ncbi:hypothetical protein VBJ27_10590, partial [Enterobacter hormaechei]|nr:hypothetical protein [Enterobacter hormaechei]
VFSYVENQNGWHNWFYLNDMKRNALSRSGPAYYDKMRFKTFNDSRSQKKGFRRYIIVDRQTSPKKRWCQPR